jgi:hypothetical protein
MAGNVTLPSDLVAKALKLAQDAKRLSEKQSVATGFTPAPSGVSASPLPGASAVNPTPAKR